MHRAMHHTPRLDRNATTARARLVVPAPHSPLLWLLTGLLLSTALLLGAAPVRATTDGAADLLALVRARDTGALMERGPQVMAELAALYRTSDPEQRTDIAYQLYAIGWKSEEAADALLADVGTDRRDLRIAVQYALPRVSSDDRIVDILLETMRRDDERWIFRDKAACSLAYDQIHLTERQKVRLFSQLIRSLADPELGTRALAVQVLAVYTGQTKGYVPHAPAAERERQIEPWYRWLAEYRAQVFGE